MSAILPPPPDDEEARHVLGCALIFGPIFAIMWAIACIAYFARHR